MVGSPVETSTFAITPFLRNLLLSNGMKAFKSLQATCPAYLALGDSISELIVLGTPADQRQTMVSVKSGFVAAFVAGLALSVLHVA